MSIKLLQISDLHLGESYSYIIRKTNTYYNFIKTINKINNFIEHTNCHDLWITGDISHQPASKSYYNFIKGLRKLNLAINCVPGNHDNPYILNELLAYTDYLYCPIIKHKKWTLIGLNTCQYGFASGLLNSYQLARLTSSLNNLTTPYVALVMHHHPLEIGIGWLDDIMLTNKQQLWDIVKNFKQVRLILCGHVHQETEKNFQGVAVFSCSATSFKLYDNYQTKEISNIDLGFRFIELHDDGKIITKMVYLD